MNTGSKIYIGTGGYSDSDLLGTLYPHGTPKADFLQVYSCHYDTVEINSTFHAPLGQKALSGMLNKAEGRLKFSLKLHQDFSHTRTATAEQARHFLHALQPLIEQNRLANLLVQFPQSFDRTPPNRRHLAKVCQWFADVDLAVEFRHASWHTPPVFEAFAKSPKLIWCNADFAPNIGLPTFDFRCFGRTSYLRLHGRNLNWHHATSAAERHDYRYTDDELCQLADTLYHRRREFDTLYLYFQNTTHAHSFYNINTLKSHLNARGFQVKTTTDNLSGEQGRLF
ncbi:uncharacterized protein YecE (DUF72 family) [Nicoletella semolina]|uniref:Uncharacterized protein YecE (DUF72 family) n=1 Tax=Nicoletella semolina TaxID=271160 RepID=A0A4R2N6F4_9PAST|nr:DUF72 domain-containing protein [Nicoletella semolina]MDH2925218.1 hypothetical protein [Nicoletella semolina]TCP16467.1 uncharacterized protein YecE (DUF72 family) [Nicoletella semolina]